jgi:hypothetical protein
MNKAFGTRLLALKGFSFDGDTGRTLKDLYKEVTSIGGQKDAPFVDSFPIKGRETPAAVNSYLDPDGKRFYVIWQSEKSGLSHVIDIVFDAPSLAKVKSEDSCSSCNAGMPELLADMHKDE